MATVLDKGRLNNLANEIWKSAERLRGKFKAYEYQNVILPIIVLRRIECVLIEWREKQAEAMRKRQPDITDKEPKSFGNKRNRILDTHRAWIEERHRDGWADGYEDEYVQLFTKEDFAYHKVSVVFWQTDENDEPAYVTEPYPKTFSAANVKKDQDFYAGDLDFSIAATWREAAREAAGPPGKEKGGTAAPPSVSKTERNKVIKRFIKELDFAATYTHRHYVADHEYIPYGEDIEAFLKREIAKPIIRWEDAPQLGYEILTNKYFYRYEPPKAADAVLEDFWKLEREAEAMLEGLR